MCITQAEMLGEEYEEVKQKKKLQGLENRRRKIGAYTIIIMLIHN